MSIKDKKNQFSTAFKGLPLQGVYSYFLNNKRRIFVFLLLPFVLYGLYYIYEQHSSKGVETYAVDPLVVTYNGGPPPNPIFDLSDMKPGDNYERCFNVKNTSIDSFSVIMSGLKTNEEKNFSEILDISINDSNNNQIFDGKMKGFFANSPLSLGNYSPGEDKTYCIKVNFPPSAGNEYQKAVLVFDIEWKTELPDIELPPECQHLSGIITTVVEGTEQHDRIHGSIANELILAKGGNDRIDASSGHDCVVAGEGNDRVDSESGNDVILGGGGNDRIKSGSGNDKVWGGTGDDDINLGSGNDLAYGNEGEDDIDGGDGDDEIYGGSENDELRGGSGNDKLYGEAGNDNLRGNSGDDLLDGGLDTDELRGNSGTDTCIDGESTSSCEL